VRVSILSLKEERRRGEKVKEEGRRRKNLYFISPRLPLSSAKFPAKSKNVNNGRFFDRWTVDNK